MMENIPKKYKYKIIACYASFVMYAFVNFIIFHGKIHGQDNVDAERLIKLGLLIVIYGMSILFLTKKAKHVLVAIVIFGLVVPLKHIWTYWTFFIDNISTATILASFVFYGQLVPILGSTVLLMSKARNYYLESEENA